MSVDSPCRDRKVDHLLQCFEATLGLERTDARGGPYGLRWHQYGGVTETRTKLSKTANLFTNLGPPQKAIGVEDRQEFGRWLNNRAENSHQPFR